MEITKIIYRQKSSTKIKDLKIGENQTITIIPKNILFQE